jgi:Holliday junction resolvase RusA-like endonuclease
MRAFTRPGGHVGMTHGNEKKLKEYRARVAVAAEQAGARQFTGPVQLEARFFVQRPKSYYGSGRNAGLLKPSAPLFPTTAPDLSKYVRALEDALEGITWANDAQIVSLIVSKLYAETGMALRTDVTIRSLDIVSSALIANEPVQAVVVAQDGDA